MQSCAAARRAEFPVTLPVSAAPKQPGQLADLGIDPDLGARVLAVVALVMGALTLAAGQRVQQTMRRRARDAAAPQLLQLASGLMTGHTIQQLAFQARTTPEALILGAIHSFAQAATTGARHRRGRG